MHHSMLRVAGEHQLALIKLSNCRNNLYVATHGMSFPSVKQSRIYLVHYHEILRHVKLLGVSQTRQFHSVIFKV